MTGGQDWAAEQIQTSKHKGRDMIEKPENAKAFPDAKIGDRLYYCNDLEDGVFESIVVSKDDKGFCLIAPVGWDYRDNPRISFACNWHFATLAEVIEQAAIDEIGYCGPRVDWANRALDAVQSGGDLSEFVECRG